VIQEHPIRLECPACGAIHRVRRITLGKLYRCKKCQTGLVTHSPVILHCPSCHASTPPARVEVSQMHTCNQCAATPLLEVIFPSSVRPSYSSFSQQTGPTSVDSIPESWSPPAGSPAPYQSNADLNRGYPQPQESQHEAMSYSNRYRQRTVRYDTNFENPVTTEVPTRHSNMQQQAAPISSLAGSYTAPSSYQPDSDFASIRSFGASSAPPPEHTATSQNTPLVAGQEDRAITVLRQVFDKLQAPMLQEIEKSRKSVPIWLVMVVFVPITCAFGFLFSSQSILQSHLQNKTKENGELQKLLLDATTQVRDANQLKLERDNLESQRKEIDASIEHYKQLMKEHRQQMDDWEKEKQRLIADRDAMHKTANQFLERIRKLEDELQRLRASKH